YQKNSWLKVNGKMYYFDASGVMQTGWKTINNKKYYLGTDGARKLIDGEEPYVSNKTKDKPVCVATKEVASGKITYRLLTEE
ncbi:hypothetical protein D1N53_23815, partial [Clostridioides difficile]